MASPAVRAYTGEKLNACRQIHQGSQGPSIDKEAWCTGIHFAKYVLSRSFLVYLTIFIE
jgi:hypothetical protein